uniref:Uncharacterized protein n=1 Tax=Arundo donax TaxID=35708 RepID=A0A0A8YCT2_ARUDO
MMPTAHLLPVYDAKKHSLHSLVFKVSSMSISK